MCLIIVKPRGKSIPPYIRLRQAFLNNPDGFGLAYWQEGMTRVHIHKGAMTLAEAYVLLRAIPRPQDKVIVMHFRHATMGTISQGNTHPYPITKDHSLLIALELETPVAVFHNGMMLEYHSFKVTKQADGTTIYTWEADSSGLTDTQLFIKDILVGLGDALYNPQVGRLIEGYTYSKFVLFRPNSVITIGDFIKDRGCYYSNESYALKDYYKPVDKTPPASSLDFPDESEEERVWGNTNVVEKCDVCDGYVAASEIKHYEGMRLCPDCYTHCVVPMLPFGAEY